MPVGVYFGLAAYTIYAFGDALIKSLGPGTNPFMIAFWTALFSVIPVILTRPKGEHLRETFKSKVPKRLHLRGIMSFMAVLGTVYAFTQIPLAEAYALIFMTPVFLTVFSVLLLKEKMTAGRWAGLALGFFAVMLVVRPGFRELQLGHITALSATVLAAGVSTILKQVSQTEKRITIIGYSVGYALIMNAGIMIFGGLQMLPNPQQFVTLAIVGTFGGAGNVLIIQAAKNAPMAFVAPTQYIQIAWAVALGALFFAEIPGPFVFVGLLVMAFAGYLCFPSGGNRSPIGGYAFLSAPRRFWRRNSNAAAGETAAASKPDTPTQAD